MSKTLEKLQERMRNDGHDDAAAALEEVDFLMREYAFTKDPLTREAQILAFDLRRLVNEWTKDFAPYKPTEFFYHLCLEDAVARNLAPLMSSETLGSSKYPDALEHKMINLKATNRGDSTERPSVETAILEKVYEALATMQKRDFKQAKKGLAQAGSILMELFRMSAEYESRQQGRNNAP